MCVPTPSTNMTVRDTQNKDITLESNRYLMDTTDRHVHNPINSMLLNIIDWDNSLTPHPNTFIPAMMPIASAVIRITIPAPNPVFQMLNE